MSIDKRNIVKKLILLLAILLTGCVNAPKDIKPVENFDLKSYLGTWYEIARLDHSFERGMEQITATYSMRKDGGVMVINRGYKTDDAKWSQAVGKAYFVKEPDIGFLKVSFFGPFYGSYIIFDLDYDKYSLISGPDHSYLWILSRTPDLDQKTKEKLIEKAQKAGFDTSKLIFVKQSE